MGIKDPDERRTYGRTWRANRRIFYIDLMGGCCVKCGTTDQLEVDHIDPSTKSMNPTRLWSRTHEIIMEELSKCQLLCKKCHQEKTSAERIANRDLQHGEYGMYKWYKCRCQPCRDANSARVRLQRANKKASD